MEARSCMRLPMFRASMMDPDHEPPLTPCVPPDAVWAATAAGAAATAGAPAVGAGAAPPNVRPSCETICGTALPGCCGLSASVWRIARATPGSRNILVCVSLSALTNCMAISLLPRCLLDTGTMEAVAGARRTRRGGPNGGCPWTPPSSGVRAVAGASGGAKPCIGAGADASGSGGSPPAPGMVHCGTPAGEGNVEFSGICTPPTGCGPPGGIPGPGGPPGDIQLNWGGASWEGARMVDGLGPRPGGGPPP
mmetsp:Transcript_44999/g.121221  ORF Transcript_44999/g.121221 Transcript_44999/m.121221 type:complete len:251 (+) Transcript_44999:405-1157(+)